MNQKDIVPTLKDIHYIINRSCLHFIEKLKYEDNFEINIMKKALYRLNMVIKELE